MDTSQNNNQNQAGNTPPQAPVLAPQQPVDIAKTIRNGWILLGVAALVTIVGILYGYALAASAFISAFAGRLGLQAKNKPLAITALVFCGLTLAFFIFVSVVGE